MVSEIDVLRFLSGNGYGRGYGYGRGRGYGRGGYGRGRGYGRGGYGNGDGGYGNGYGDGGYGNGYGYGYGDGIMEISGNKVYKVDGVSTVIYSIHGDYAKCATIKNNTILVDCYVAKYQGFFAHGETLKDAIRAAKEKYEENRPLEDRIDTFVKAYPTLESTGTGEDFFSWHHILTGSCEFGRKEFCEAHDVEMDETYTVGYFLNLVKNSYGSETIRQTLNRYKEL